MKYDWTREIPEIEAFGCKPIDCTQSTYGNWSECFGQCDNGTKTSSRLIGEVSQYGGKNCSGNDTRIKPCSLAPCPHININIVIGSSSIGGLLLIAMFTSCCMMKKTCYSKKHTTEEETTGPHGNRKKLTIIGGSGHNSKDGEDSKAVENPYYGCDGGGMDDSTRIRNQFNEFENKEIVNVSTNIYYGL